MDAVAVGLDAVAVAVVGAPDDDPRTRSITLDKRFSIPGTGPVDDPGVARAFDGVSSLASAFGADCVAGGLEACQARTAIGWGWLFLTGGFG